MRARRGKSIPGALAILFLTGCLVPGPFSVSFCSTPVNAQQAVTAFSHVNIIPMSSDSVLRDYTVIVRNRVIESFGPSQRVKIIKDAVVVDGHNKWLLPGLADMHVHLWSRGDLLMFLANGITTVRNMWGTPEHLKWRADIRAGTMLGPEIYTTGPIMDGPPPYWEGSTVIDSPDKAFASVKEQKAAGYDFLKVYNGLQREPYDAIIAAGKQFGLPVVGHVPDSLGLMYVLHAGQRSIEHLEGYLHYIVSDSSPYKNSSDWASRAKNCDYVDSAKVREAVKATVEAGAWNCVTLVVYKGFEGMTVPTEAKRLRARPEMKYVSPLVLAMWEPSQDFRIEGISDSVYRYLYKADTSRSSLTLALHKAGAGILLGTDTPNPYVIPGYSAQDELQNLVDAGLTPYEAIRAGTYDAARFLGALDTFGVIAVGRRADLLLVDDNPLNDVGNLKKVSGVMVRGRWIPHAELQARLDSLAASYREPKQRFATLPPLAPDSTGPSLERFEMLLGNVDYGEERYVVSRSNAGMEIESQRVVDPPDPYAETIREHVRYDTTGACISLTLDQMTDAGAEHLDLAQGLAGPTLSGTQVDGSAVSAGAPLAPTAFVRGTGIADFTALWPRLRDLRQGDSLQLQSYCVVTTPKLTLETETVTAVRTEPSSPGLCTYKISLRAEFSVSGYNVDFAPDGGIRAVTEQRQSGATEYRRVK